jgi:hypothetical protein
LRVVGIMAEQNKGHRTESSFQGCLARGERSCGDRGGKLAVLRADAVEQ